MPAKILVVHYEIRIAEVVSEILQGVGYEVRTELSSAAAIQNAEAFTPRLLIIDLVMPLISGLDVAQKISKQTGCKILFINPCATNGAFDDTYHELQIQGCDCEALATPFDRKELLEYVETFLTNSRMRPFRLPAFLPCQN
jgi:DNA-binding response OmpR family regulator